PIGPSRVQPADQDPSGPVGRRRNRNAGLSDDPAKLVVFGDLDGECLWSPFIERPSGPEEYAVRRGIARGDALREQVASLAPVDLGTRACLSAQRQSGAAGRGLFDKFSAVDSAHIRLVISIRSPGWRGPPPQTGETAGIIGDRT